MPALNFDFSPKIYFSFVHSSHPEKVISPSHVLYVIVQISTALQYIHSKGLAHRDIKPENVLIARDGTLKVGDMGITRRTNSKGAGMQTFAGTPAYLAPEILDVHRQKRKDYDQKVDIWALGMINYAMLKNRDSN